MQTIGDKNQIGFSGYSIRKRFTKFNSVAMANFCPAFAASTYLIMASVETTKSKGDEYNQRDMSLYKLDYDQNFWNNLSLPPETKF
ncbi:MAG: hypothetical protein Q9M18_00240, partial [Mariprofundaceae bacterium]|nr:hypothetical protein [Mariprofundaceae bacterium]